jgi:hypothetical protein
LGCELGASRDFKYACQSVGTRGYVVPYTVA